MSVISFNPLYGRPLRDNEQRAKTAILLIWIVLGVEILSLGSSVAQYFLLHNVRQGVEYSEFVLSANDLREGLIGFLFLVVYIVSAVTFIRWFRRAYYNFHTRVTHLSWKEGWAAGAWFVPILSLFLPYQIMKDMYQGTRHVLSERGLVRDPALLPTGMLGTWWALWVISGILSNIIFRLSLWAESVDELLVSTIGNIVVEVLGIPLAIVTVKVIRDYARVEPALARVVREEMPVQRSESAPNFEQP